MSSQSVLIVEDDRINRECLTRLVRQLGCDVRAAACVRDGLAELEHRPHCLILDLHLPDGTGVDVARAARESNPGCTIVFLTGSADRSQLAFEPDAFFVKPVHPDEPLTWIQRACNGHRHRSA